MAFKEQIHENAIMIINGALILVGGYIFMELWPVDGEGFNKMIPLAAIGIILYLLNTQLMNKSEQKKEAVPNLGPPQQFNPPNSNIWDYDKDGVPIVRNIPPRQGRF